MQTIIVPDRYEVLARKVPDSSISQLVVRVPQTLQQFDEVFKVMASAGRGAFVVLRGDSGSGKSTFLHTLKVFKRDVETVSIESGASIKSKLVSAPVMAPYRVFVLEEREAALTFSDSELETWLHEINAFLRTAAGEKCLVVWPCNTDALRDRIVRVARAIGGSALLPESTGVINFIGPEKTEYVKIASRTLSLANQSASISDLGLSEARLTELSLNSTVLGDFFSRIHGEIAAMQGGVSKLIDQEQCRLWILVVAGNEPDGDVAALTRGAYASIDTERLMSATEANIVAELKRIPEKVGIVGTVLDAKIFHLPVLTANSIIRSFASVTLKQRLLFRKFSVGTQNAKSKKDALERLGKTEFAQVMAGRPTGVRGRKKLGSESVAAFDKLSTIAENNDNELNQAIGEALVASGLAVRYELEKDFGQGLSRRTDLIVHTTSGKIRVEVMWRKKTGRADIANYTLSKVYNYARAIGFL